MNHSQDAANGHSHGETSAIDSLRESVQTLRSLFQATLVALVILAGSLSIFLLREVSLVRQQVRELNQFASTYETTTVPMMRDFRYKLIEFARLNPDFAPILSKYFNPTNFSDSPKVMPAPEPREGQAPRLPELPEN
ncbi:MAG: hypothetical protein O2960_10410 [Verrucomicrobia bacterium]|nr:hypothetical protein [Verrucomicrobiota bacterium]